ncbi:MAG: NapC/NirT family cytochrome c, partial [Chloroflexota bacterium]
MAQLRRTTPNLLFIIAGLLFFLGGMSAYTFVQAEGQSYFSDDPNSCTNCHVMQEQFDAWGHSSHARVASCNDCHSPHNNALNKYVAKGVNGFNHSAAFTLNTYDEVI